MITDLAATNMACDYSYRITRDSLKWDAASNKDAKSDGSNVEI